MPKGKINIDRKLRIHKHLYALCLDIACLVLNSLKLATGMHMVCDVAYNSIVFLV